MGCSQLYKCEQFFALDNTAPKSKVRIASIHLEGSALQWHLNYMPSNFNIYPSWPQYISNITLRFGNVYEDPLSILIQVKQTGKVQEYVDEFELVLTQVTLPPGHSLSIFLAGLEHNTQMHMRMFSPTTIAHAANLARLHESSKTTLPHIEPTNWTNSSLPPFDSKLNCRANSLYLNPTTKPIISKTPRSYSAVEMAERRVESLYMFCDEPFTLGHQLKHKRSQLLVMEMDKEETVDEELEIIEENGVMSMNPTQIDRPQLSMNTLSSASTYQTMMVSGLHNKKLLQILIDSGSTHNFLDLELPKKNWVAN